ncbi:hypothetical protein RHMOL_Rhmol04G0058400 [Rhododendron molle]|uniref:Uncharacterized protein n=1 Tax=Rhododendron molle TaxID=49168 RepID=A0ACC0NZY7_RHOML|nr:hypothetical protein RHMOL_Rhmol04G0058400 [Rhododendron molle]
MGKRKRLRDDDAHVLSFLSTKDAIRTFTLSTKWAYVWTFIFDINLKYANYRCPLAGEEKDSSFLDFVEIVYSTFAIPVMSRNLLEFCRHAVSMVRLVIFFYDFLTLGVFKSGQVLYFARLLGYCLRKHSCKFMLIGPVDILFSQFVGSLADVRVTTKGDILSTGAERRTHPHKWATPPAGL